ncbi:FAD-binding oxidoreductase [Vannielia litorea]|uniref:NAD(P)/FAD-dependent oxidoreductase n=1 Tax=Vannielia litorea TaxID=1217970 RepID=UPI001C9483E9|nr:FAD-binding oxidoreductase [Vannielia litorea]MBY6154893.1 FAD-binding oxidoreductase [Vannielia litorea]
MVLKTTPYWWDTTPLAQIERGDLPARADAVVIGSGYTGLHAALQISRGGRSVVVLEKGRIGEGCSTRNGGQLSYSIKPSLLELTANHGAELAAEIRAEGPASLAFLGEFIKAESIDCDYHICGRFDGAATARAWVEMNHEADGESIISVPKDRQREEIGSDWYHGGIVHKNYGALDPGRYHAGLLGKVLEAGVTVLPNCSVIAMDEGIDEVVVRTEHGSITTKDVVVGTNGYTQVATPWHRERVIPIGSYIIATEELSADVMDRLFPKNRMHCDSRRVIYYYRASPDKKRVLFGGRAAAGEAGAKVAAERLRAEMVRLFPELESVRITHSWMGFVAFSFDKLAHAGARGRIRHAMGYCGSGVGMASYLGMKAGLKVLGDPAGETPLMTPRFPTRPFYKGDPWFLPAAVAGYRMLDRLGL